MMTPPAPTNLSHRFPWGRILAWGGVFLLITVLAAALFQTQEGRPREGQEAPTFTLTTYDDQQITLESLKGKIVLVNFWASWCITCKEEAGYLEEAWRHYLPGGEVVFLGIAWTDTDSKAMEYLKYYDITYTNGPDLGTRIAHRYRITGVPETFIIDRNGAVAVVHLAPFVSTAEVLSKIDPLLQP